MIEEDDSKYFVFYDMITKEHIECGCFCSMGNCEEDFFVNEIVIRMEGNLFHIKCFNRNDIKIKRPQFTDRPTKIPEDYLIELRKKRRNFID